MRTKRTIAAKKPASRAAKMHRAVGTPKHVANWIAGMDRLSLGIAAAAILGAGVLVAAYRPARIEARSPLSTSLDAQRDAAVASEARPEASPPIEKVAIDDAPPATAQWPAPLTITGCLERDDDGFRLTDASGAGVPKSRSWKSGFLKKSGSSVTVIDAERRARLRDHVGQRVSVTGTMVNREMQLNTLKTIAGSCSGKKV